LLTGASLSSLPADAPDWGQHPARDGTTSAGVPADLALSPRPPRITHHTERLGRPAYERLQADGEDMTALPVPLPASSLSGARHDRPGSREAGCVARPSRCSRHAWSRRHHGSPASRECGAHIRLEAQANAALPRGDAPRRHVYAADAQVRHAVLQMTRDNADYALELSAVLASLEEAHIAPHRAPIRSPGQGGSRAAQQPGAVTVGGGTWRANDAPRRRRAQW
jgi:hypothetical protein